VTALPLLGSSVSPQMFNLLYGRPSLESNPFFEAIILVHQLPAIERLCMEDPSHKSTRGLRQPAAPLQRWKPSPPSSSKNRRLDESEQDRTITLRLTSRSRCYGFLRTLMATTLTSPISWEDNLPTVYCPYSRPLPCTWLILTGETIETNRLLRKAVPSQQQIASEDQMIPITVQDKKPPRMQKIHCPLTRKTQYIKYKAQSRVLLVVPKPVNSKAPSTTSASPAFPFSTIYQDVPSKQPVPVRQQPPTLSQYLDSTSKVGDKHKRYYHTDLSSPQRKPARSDILPRLSRPHAERRILHHQIHHCRWRPKLTHSMQFCS
jgi:hypothetical protein